MRLPMVKIHSGKIRHNARVLKEQLNRKHIACIGVTKGVLAHPDVVNAFLDAGIDHLADSRIQNVKRIRDWGFTGEVTLLRAPMNAEAAETIAFADNCIISEIHTLEKLETEARKQGKNHGYLVMVDVGDRREGVLPAQVLNFMEAVKDFTNIQFKGLAANVGCFSGVLPTYDHIVVLEELAQTLSESGIDVPVISGGNTSSLVLANRNELPESVNQLRIGEGLLTGSETVTGEIFDNTYQDAFRLKAEIIEIKKKPSMPVGEKGDVLFEGSSTFFDKGDRLRAVLALGRQDVMLNGLIPVEDDIEIEGGSSDHIILDVTTASQRYAVGDEVEFYLSYSAIVTSFTSPYVQKLPILEERSGKKFEGNKTAHSDSNEGG